MKFLPSTTQTVDGYEVSLGQSSGTYDTVVDIPLASITNIGNVWSYDLTLEFDRDYYLVLRAYNAVGMSENSNEIQVGALVSAAIGIPSGASEIPVQATSAYSRPPSSMDMEGLVSTAAAASGESDEIIARDAPTSSHDDRVADSEQGKLERDRATSIELDGDGEYLASSESVALGTGYAFSFSIWARPALDDAARRSLIDLRDVAGDANRITLVVVDSASVELTLCGADGAFLHQARFDDVLLDAEWQHVALVFDGDIDFEPRLYLDAQQQLASEVVSNEGEWAMSDSPRRVVIGADTTGSSASWRGQVGHAAIWSIALADSVIQEVSRGGHDTDLRRAGVSSNAQEHLMHYWRLGADADGIGFDHGSAAVPLDLDDPSGSVDAADIVADAPSTL